MTSDIKEKINKGELFHQETTKDGWDIRFGKIENLDRQFDIDFWQNQTTNERFSAAWNLVAHYHLGKGESEDELRLQRSIINFQRISS